DNEEIAKQARALKDLAFSRERRYLHTDLGFNYRMTNIQAAIGLAQFERIDELAEMRRKNACLYNSYLKNIKGITLPVEKKWAKNAYWMYSILVEDEFGISRGELMDRLMKKEIDTRTFFIPMHQQPVFRNMGLFKGESYPVAEEISRKGMYLPSSSGLKEAKIRFICSAIRETKEGK
ncbi:DegT/DnrJ/EryC1/StrS family aminotransferase, partial [Chloroflexota bacterium]